jgi:hypothetical protein
MRWIGWSQYEPARRRAALTSTSKTAPPLSANSMSVRTSASEPIAIRMKRRNSAWESRAAPSEMFAGTEITARRTWRVSSNLSSAGNARQQS